ncbi:cobalt-precorrin-5B (C(1))-methyltransferase CbiD [Desulfosarcina sp. OttesenSCG-928-A07]|nr:cobalt-precorrin-5B (C(1))-methyltransferase CbiD [Desulfosarcina sp. OttesenSCG-928-A07]
MTNYPHNTFVVKGGRKLSTGFTTGSCAAAAAAAAAHMLLGKTLIQKVRITLPGGTEAVFELTDIRQEPNAVSCAVVKDAGDDPDVTDGIHIYACCRLQDSGFALKGGQGIGRMTCQGLSIPKGEPAINPVPRQSILENVKKVCARHQYKGGVEITISAPLGEKIAPNTFNPRLGIEGGISILGTTGIVEPMSEKALVDTLKLVIDRYKAVDADNILLTPGNYGKNYCSAVLGLDREKAVKFSNYLGECLDYVAYREFQRALVVGHMGKLVKVAGGIMNLHSSVADCRMELVGVHAALAGASAKQVGDMMQCKTTDAVIPLLDEWQLTETVLTSLLESIRKHLAFRVKNKLEIGVVVFSGNQTLMQSANASMLMKHFRQTSENHD